MKRYLFILGLLLTLGSTLQIRAQGDYNPELPAEPNQRYKLTLVCNMPDAAYMSGDGWYKQGTSASIGTSAWSPNYTFVHWKKGNEIISTKADFEYTVTKSETLVAVYEFTPEPPDDPSAIHEHRLYLQCTPNDACSFNRASGAKAVEDSYVDIEANLSPGFVFKGWYQDSIKVSDVKDFSYLMGNEDVTLTAKCIYSPTIPGNPTGGNQGNVDNSASGYANKYIVTFISEGETIKVDTLDVGSVISSPLPPTKYGHAFTGWSPSVDANVPSHDVVYTAQYKVNNYSITFDTDGGSNIETITQAYNSSVTKPQNPTKNGYTFAGWDKEIPATMLAENITIKALWTINKYKLTYMVNGEVYKQYEVEYNAAINPEIAPEKEGYKFSGWSEIPATMPANDVELAGSFTISKYRVAFISNGVTVKEETLDFGSTITAPDNPTRIGHTFTGWNPAVDETVPSQDVTYTAQFSVNQYTISFDTDGGSEITPVSQNYNTAITVPANPTKTGYTFTGWDKEIPATMPAENTTVKALWTINKYKLTYKVDGETYRVYDVEYNAAINPEAAPEKEGYTFSGWSEIPAIMPAENIEIVGEFRKVEISYITIDDITSLIADYLQIGTTVTINDITNLIHRYLEQ